MTAKTSMIAGAVLTIGLLNPMVAQGGCFDDPCPPEKPKPVATSWRQANFAAPNGGVVVYKIMPSGDPACASYDGRNCLWGEGLNHVRLNDVHPLICGANHRAQWGVTGYENPRHWCNLAKQVARLD